MVLTKKEMETKSDLFVAGLVEGLLSAMVKLKHMSIRTVSRIHKV